MRTKIGISDIRIILKEFGVKWLINRSIYSVKLKMLRLVPSSEKLFEKRINIKRIDIINFDVKKIEKFLENLPGGKKNKIIERADMALQGKIIGFSNIEMDYGMPIQWQLNPLTGREAEKRKKWFGIPDFDPERGDVKAIWEISRFSYAYFLLRAYMLTKDIKYYQGFSDQINWWVKENQYSYGANFKCGQECTLRMMNVLAVYSGFKAYGLVDERDEKNVFKIVETGYKKVLSNFFYAHKCIKNDHTIAELCGMIIGAWCIEDKERVNKYFSELTKELEEQFSEDGMYLSYSFNYQRYVLQLIEYIIKISDVIDQKFDEKLNQRLYNAAMLLYQSQDNCGKVPNYGANDGTLLFPVTVCGFRNYCPIINTISKLTKGKSHYLPGSYEEEYLWFSNKNEISAYEPIERVSLSCMESGLYHYRNKKMYMMLNAHNYEKRPGHMDQLHFDLWVDGENVFCDTGTYSYAEKAAEKLSGTEGHNTVKPAGTEQMKKIGKFLAYGVPKTKRIKCTEEEISVGLTCKTGYYHCRNVKFYKNEIIIKDYVDQNGCLTDYSILFHTPCQVEQNDNVVYFYGKDNQNICRLEISGGKINIKASYASWYYLDRQKIFLIEVQCTEKENEIKIVVEE